MNEASDQQENVSVFDFLYYDATRVSSFLAQFESVGHVTQVTKNEQANRGSKDTQATEFSGSIKVAAGKLTDNSEISKGFGREVTKIYDPRWENALAFLDYVAQNNLLVREIQNARIGQITLITGDLSIFDLSILQKMWALPTIKRIMVAGAQGGAPREANNRHERRKAGAFKKNEAAEPSEAELALELMTVLPHAIQAAVSTDTSSVWCSLRDDSVTISPSDLFMKHGITITGEWAMVGILDALPDDSTEVGDGVTLEAARQMVAGSKLGMLGFLIAPHLVTPVRTMLGRPASSYGMTPLLIFRNVLEKNDD